jgi:hypothetical protein
MIKVIMRTNYASSIYGCASIGKPITLPNDEAKRLIDAECAFLSPVKKVVGQESVPAQPKGNPNKPKGKQVIRGDKT